MTDTSQRPGVLARFRRWRRSRPFWAGAWTLIGAVIILAIPLLPVSDMVSAAIAGASSVLVGVLILVMGLFIWFSPANRTLAGVLAMIFSVASLVLSNLGGLVVGMICGIVGGALALAWTDKPRPTKRRSSAAESGESDESATEPADSSAGAGAGPAEPRSEEAGSTSPTPSPRPRPPAAGLRLFGAGPAAEVTSCALSSRPCPPAAGLRLFGRLFRSGSVAGSASPALSSRPCPPAAGLRLFGREVRSGRARLVPRSVIVAVVAAVVAALAVPLSPTASADTDVTHCLGFDQILTLPAQSLAAVPLPVLAQLPAEQLGRLPAEVLALLPVDVLATLSSQVWAQLPAELARLVPRGLPLIGGLLPQAPAATGQPAPGGCPAGQLPIPASLLPALPGQPALPSVPGLAALPTAPSQPASPPPGEPGAAEPPAAQPVDPGTEQRMRDELLAGRAQTSAGALAVVAGTVAPTVGSKLTMADLTIRGLIYQGLVDVPTITGSKRIMRFTIDEIDANGLTLALPLPGGDVLGLRHTLDRHVIGKQVVLDCTRLRLRVLGLLDLDFDINGFIPPPGLALPIELPTENVDIDLVTLTLATLSVPTADAVVGRPVATATDPAGA